MNNSSKMIVHEISGYNGLDEGGARNDSYYECKTAEQQLQFIFEMMEHLNLHISFGDGLDVWRFLNHEFTNSNDMYHAWKSLS